MITITEGLLIYFGIGLLYIIGSGIWIYLSKGERFGLVFILLCLLCWPLLILVLALWFCDHYGLFFKKLWWGSSFDK